MAWDVFRPFPLADGVADVVLDVFAPRNPAEFHRVLRPTGRLIVVRPPGGTWPSCVSGWPRWLRSTRPRNNACTGRWTPYFKAVVTEQVEYSAPLTRLEALGSGWNGAERCH